jgi:hypothetical protein
MYVYAYTHESHVEAHGKEGENYEQNPDSLEIGA